MSTSARVAGFVAAMAVIFGLAFLIGRAVGTADDAPATPSHSDVGTHGQQSADAHRGQAPAMAYSVTAQQ